MTLLGLPTEILYEVMSLLSVGQKWIDTNKTKWDFSEPASNQDIQNVRLSCRYLSKLAGRYLIGHVRVGLSEASLSNLEKICRQPDIRYSVQAVQVSLAQYDDGLTDDGLAGDRIAGDRIAKSLEKFAQYYMALLSESRLYSEDMIPRARYIAWIWSIYLEGRKSRNYHFFGSFDREQIGYINALWHGHRLYQRGLREQKSLIDNSFTARVADAVARLPLVKHLELTHRDISWGPQSHWQHPWRSLDISTDQSFAYSLSQCRRPSGEIHGPDLVHLILRILMGIAPKVGTGITSLDIKVSLQQDSGFVLGFLQEDLIKTNLEKLRSFRLENHENFWQSSRREPDEFALISRFLNACLQSRNLECLFIDTQLASNSQQGITIPLPKPKLKHAVLIGLPISESNLEALIAPIASSPEGSLALYGMELTDGTWAGVLDTLRNRRVRVELGFQTGAECDTFGWGDSPFAAVNGQPSFAEHYVRGEDMANPVLSRPSEEVRNRLFGPAPGDQGGLAVENDEGSDGGW